MTVTDLAYEISNEKKERRRTRRYNLSLPATVSTFGQESLKGKSRDVSTRGVYLVFSGSDRLVPGTEIDLTLTLPKEVTAEEDVIVRAHGRTLRLDTYGENGSTTIGVAVAFERHYFVRSSSSLR